MIGPPTQIRKQVCSLLVSEPQKWCVLCCDNMSRLRVLPLSTLGILYDHGVVFSFTLVLFRYRSIPDANKRRCCNGSVKLAGITSQFLYVLDLKCNGHATDRKLELKMSLPEPLSAIMDSLKVEIQKVNALNSKVFRKNCDAHIKNLKYYIVEDGVVTMNIGELVVSGLELLEVIETQIFTPMNADVKRNVVLEKHQALYESLRSVRPSLEAQRLGFGW